jgi:site-specific DNA recombinase
LCIVLFCGCFILFKDKDAAPAGCCRIYVRTYHEERKRLSAKVNAKRTHLELRLGELKREIDRLVDAVAKGHGDPAVLGPRSSTLNEERKQVAIELNGEPAVNNAISLHPAVLARYQEQLVELQDALRKSINAGDSDAAEANSGTSRARPLAMDQKPMPAEP